MEPYQARVAAEKTELDDRRVKLAAFFNTETYAQLPQEERDRLERQAFHMGAYSDILAERIAAFETRV